MNQQMSSSELQEMADELRSIQEQFAEAWEQLAQVVREVGDENAKAYLVEPLQIHIFGDHGFLSRDLNIESLADRWEAQAAEMDE